MVTSQLGSEVVGQVMRMVAQGLSYREIGRRVGCSAHGVVNVFMRERAALAVPWSPAPGRLSLAHREEIRVGLVSGWSFTRIAGQLRRSVSTVSREVNANGGSAERQAERARPLALVALI